MGGLGEGELRMGEMGERRGGGEEGRRVKMSEEGEEGEEQREACSCAMRRMTDAHHSLRDTPTRSSISVGFDAVAQEPQSSPCFASGFS